MLVQLTMAGNFRERTLRVEPTGEKHRTTCTWIITRLIWLVLWLQYNSRTINNNSIYKTEYQFVTDIQHFHNIHIAIHLKGRLQLTLSCLRTLSMKNDQQFSLVSCIPAPLTSLRIPLTTFWTSSSANNSGISPEANRSLITTRNFSSGTWASVRRNTVPTPFRPALMYSWARSA